MTEQPIGTPPAGGSWLWDAEGEAWIENPDFPAAPAPEPELAPQE